MASEPEAPDSPRSSTRFSAQWQNSGEYRSDENPPAPPIFNIPPIMLGFMGLLVAIHGVRVFLLSPEQNIHSIIAFAFIPARYAASAEQLPYPLAEIWSPVTYALLHGDWGHVLMNVIWMLAFGAIIARRIGVVRFVLFAIFTALGGAALHYVFHMNEMVPVIGASAVVSGFMGAAARFAFRRIAAGMDVARLPMLSLIETFTNRQVLTFLALWFGLNFLFGSGIIAIAGEGQDIAWQAHIGGFLAGLFGFSFFDRARRPQG